MRAVLSLLLLTCGACASTYHPDFHPVTVSDVVVTNPRPVVVAQPQPPGVPFEFFDLQ